MCMAYLCCCQDAEEEGGLRLKHPAGLAVAGTCSTRAAELWYNNPLERDQDQQLHPENGCWSCRKSDCMILALCIASVYSWFSHFSEKFGVLCCWKYTFQARTSMFKSVWLLKIPLHQFLFSMAILQSSQSSAFSPANSFELFPSTSQWSQRFTLSSHSYVLSTNVLEFPK